jgi:hypothetical protein
MKGHRLPPESLHFKNDKDLATAVWQNSMQQRAAVNIKGNYS